MKLIIFLWKLIVKYTGCGHDWKVIVFRSRPSAINMQHYIHTWPKRAVPKSVSKGIPWEKAVQRGPVLEVWEDSDLKD